VTSILAGPCYLKLFQNICQNPMNLPHLRDSLQEPTCLPQPDSGLSLPPSRESACRRKMTSDIACSLLSQLHNPSRLAEEATTPTVRRSLQVSGNDLHNAIFYHDKAIRQCLNHAYFDCLNSVKKCSHFLRVTDSHRRGRLAQLK